MDDRPSTGRPAGRALESVHAQPPGPSGSKEGYLEIGTPDVTHRIENPDEIYVQEEGGQLLSIEVRAPDATKQVVELQRG